MSLSEWAVRIPSRSEDVGFTRRVVEGWRQTEPDASVSDCWHVDLRVIVCRCMLVCALKLVNACASSNGHFSGEFEAKRDEWTTRENHMTTPLETEAVEDDRAENRRAERMWQEGG
jgi:hypothetical protein